MKYIVKYNGIEIGIYNVISNKCVEYTIFEEGMNKLKEKGIQVFPLLAKDFEGKEFPFFDNSIRDSKRFEGVPIGYQTDPVELEEMS